MDAPMKREALLRELALRQLRKNRPAGPEAAAIPAADRAAPLPLSWAQQRLWFLDRLDHAAGRAYHIPAVLRLTGNLNAAALRATLDRLADRHEVLRTRIVMEGDAPRQSIAAPGAGFALTELDVSALAGAEQEAALARIRADEAAAPFDLERGPLVRASLVRVSAACHELLFTQHHIVSDGWSIGVLVREVAALYPAFRAGRPDPLPALAIQYADYAAWQRDWLRGAELERQLGFWKRYLGGAPALLELPTDRARPARQSYAGASMVKALSAPLSAALRALGQRHGATLFMTLLAGWSVLLSRLSGQRDVVIGTPVANRQRSELEALVGFFVNTLALRVNLDGDPDVAGLLATVRDATLAAYGHQDLPFEQVVDALKPRRSMAHSPLFQAMLSMNNTPGGGKLALPELELELLEQASESTHFDLSLEVQDNGEHIVCAYEYATDLFDAATIARWSGHFERVLEAMVAQPSLTASRLPLLSADETARLLALNDSEAAFPQATLLHALFESQAAARPDAPALAHDGRIHSYAELNRWSNRIAHRLLAMGVLPDQRVGLCLERGAALMAGMLGILKAGAGFVPLDPGHPDARLTYMADDSAPVAIVAQSSLRDRLARLGAPLLLLDTDAALDGQPTRDPAPSTLAAHHLAYVIYTSGSTGRPKGVMVEHRNVVNLAHGHVRACALTAEDRVLQFAPYSFDSSVAEIWSAWAAGALLVLRPEQLRTPDARFGAFLREWDISVTDLPTAFWHQWAQVLELCPAPPGLRLVLVGGEKAESRHLRRWFAHPSTAAIGWRNCYGPTEATVNAAMMACDAASAPEGDIGIGRPVANARLHLLDGHGQPVPLGVTGEIHIGGAGVARGYLNLPDLSAERFIADPFVAGARLYRTGDLGRYRADGALEYVGRNDFQVKLRGFRIELGEIEAALLACDGVAEAVVVARQDGEDDGGEARLVAYLVGRADAPLEAGVLRQALARTLPDYMLPSAVVRLAAWPLTANGKLDRAALPAPGHADSARAVFEAPEGEVERALAAIWMRLLGLEQVGRRDNFFDIGGHSLMAVRMISALRDALGIELALRELFAHPILADLAASAALARPTNMGTIAALSRADAAGALPLSWAQQRLWFLAQLDAAAGVAYHIPAALRLEGRLDVDALRATLARLIDRHEVLRTRIVLDNGSPLQLAAPPGGGFALSEQDLSALSGAEQQTAVERIRADEALAPFDLATGPLIRARLLRLADQRNELLLTQHHIVSDGWSSAVLQREICALYAAFSQGRPDPLPALPIQYADYAAWQRGWLQGAELARQLDFWKNRLAGAPVLLTLPADRARPARQSYAGASFEQTLSPELGAGLVRLGRRQGATLFMTLLAAWSVLLARLSGQRDIVIGAPVANRQRSEVEALVGFFVNTLAVRVDLESDPSVADLLDQVRDATLASYSHQDLPFEQVVDALKPQRSLGHNAIFQTTITLDNTPPSGALDLPGLRLEGVPLRHGTTQFDLSLRMVEGEHGILCSYEYATDLFDHATIARWAGHFDTLLAAMVAGPARRVSELALLDQAQLERLMRFATGGGRAGAGLVHHYVEARARDTPDAPALLAGAEVLSYAELNRRANRLAHRLLAIGVRLESRVGIYAGRCGDFVTGMLAVLKAGGAYVPLDPAYPEERIAHMCEDSGLVAVLTTDALQDALPVSNLVRIVLLDAPHPPGQDHDPAVASGPDALAYVMYTSGSTGLPKGVMVTHRNVVHLARNGAVAELGAGDRIAHCASPAFDAATWEVWGALLNGASVLVVPHEVVLDPAALSRVLIDGGVSALWLTVGLFNAYADALETAFGTLRYLLVGGDALDARTVARVLARARRPQYLINGYGPTETTTFAATHVVRDVAPDATGVPIGRPIRHGLIHILDQAMRPVPVGVTGQIHIGGAGVARGYLNQPELSAQSFVDDPFAPGARLYRSGDLGRWLDDGTIEFQGRGDKQLKLRGYRIEPGEIEARLRDCDGVRDALVLLREDTPGDRRLVAYVLAHDGAAAADAATLRRDLAAVLPDYMLPAAFVQLDAWPLTANGKLDRQALPAPGQSDLASTAYQAPQGDIETALASIWSSLLGARRVGRADSFFELGGHSLLAVRLISAVRTELGLELALRDLFAQPTLQGFAALAAATRPASMAAIGLADRAAPLPLSWAQQRLWFLDRLDHAAGRAYHIPAVLRLTGNLNAAALRATLDRLADRHEVLRTRIVMEGDAPRQSIAAPGAGFALTELDVSALAGAEQEAALARIRADEAAAPFDLERGPLVRASLVRVSAACHELLFTQHHIVSDGWSIGVLVREVAALYPAFRAGRPDPLPALAIQYADYAAWQRDWLRGAELERQLGFWKRYLGGAPALLELPTDRARPARQSYAGASMVKALSAPLSAALRALGQRHGATLFMTLLAGWSVLLSRLSGQRDVVIGTPVANRQRSELEALVGFFVNTLALRVNLDGDPDVAGLLATVRDATLAAYGHQDLPFEQVVDALKPRRSMAHSPLFQAMLSMNNTPGGGKLALPELELELLEQASESTHFDLSLEVQDNGEHIVCAYEYATDLFDAATIARWSGHFERVLEAMVAQPSLTASRLPLLSADETARLLALNDSEAAFPQATLLHALFESQAAARPDAPALAHDGRIHSYAELNRWSNRIAHRLLAMGVLPDQRVGLCLERGAALMAGMLGILKAGAGFVPLDPGHPDARLTYMADDSAPVAIVAQSSLRDRLARLGAPLLLLDTDAALDGQPTRDPAPSTLAAHHLAYVIYTSGSTGRPKGVMVEHRNVVNLAHGHVRACALTAEDRVLQFAPYSFDSSVAEIWSAWAAGALLVLRPEQLRTPDARFGAFLREWDISVTDLPTAFWHQWAQVLELCPAPPGLRLVLVGGEKAESRHLRRWFAHPSTAAIGWRNCYGPTEATVNAAMMACDAASAPEGDIGIGRPVANARLHLLDGHGQPVPLGVTGEIHIGGAGVARGYLNLPDLSAERFIADPFVAGARLYRTGDLGRYRADGALEYVGRNDFQVKLRGFRIELGEIEAALLACDGVAEAVVVARQDGEDDGGEARLVAYLVGRADAPLEAGVLRQALARTLPDYMLPSAVVRLAAWPLTANGKLDRAALPAPGHADSARAVFEAPEGEVERALAAIWMRLLGLEQVGRRDNFFDIGGHSLMAVRMISALRDALGIEMALMEVFRHTTLSALARWLEGEQIARYDAAEVAEAAAGLDEMSDEEVALLLEQERELAQDNAG